MPYLLDHAARLCLLAAFLWLSGHAIRRGGLSRWDPGPLRPLADFCLGAVAWMVALFGLACVGLLASWNVILLGGCATLLAFRVRRRSGVEPPALGAEDAVMTLTVMVVTSPLLLLALSPEVRWDAGTYHLLLPRRYLDAGGFVPVPMNVYSNWPLGTELLFTAAMQLGDHSVAKAVHWGFGVLTVLAAYLGCVATGRRAAGWIAAPLLLTSPLLLFEMSAAYVDVAYAFFLVCGVLFVAHALEGGAQARPALLLAGVCAGALCSLKVTGVLGAAAIALPLLPRCASGLRRRDTTPLTEVALCVGLPAVLLWIPWLAKSAAFTGNPFYPFLYDWFGGPDWSADLSLRLGIWLRSFGMGREPLDFLLLPLRVFTASGGPGNPFHGELGAHWLLLLPVAGFAALHERLARVCLIAGGAYFTAWALGSQQARFLIPLVPLIAIPSGLGAALAAERLGARARTATALLGAAALGFALVQGVRPLAAGLALLPVYLADATSLRDEAVHPIYATIDRALPADARLLLLNTNQAFFVPRDTLADSFFEASQILAWLRDASDPAGVRARLAERGITHVLVDRGREWGIRWPRALLAVLRDGVHSRSIHRSADGRFELYELR